MILKWSTNEEDYLKNIYEKKYKSGWDLRQVQWSQVAKNIQNDMSKAGYPIRTSSAYRNRIAIVSPSIKNDQIEGNAIKKRKLNNGSYCTN